jgi:uncharacterized protein (TIRG00374 family)
VTAAAVPDEPASVEVAASAPGEPASEPSVGPLSTVPHPPRARWKSALITLLKLAVVGALVLWLYRKGSIKGDDVLNAFRQPSWWGSAVPLSSAAVLIVSFRWWLLLRAADIRIPLWPAVRLGLIGFFWNMFLPGAVTGDLAKMYYVGPYAPGRRAEAYTTIILDRVIGLGALVAIAFVAALLNFSFIQAHAQLMRLFWVMVACLAGFFVGGGALVVGVGRKSALADAVKSRVPMLESVRRSYHTLLAFGSRKKSITATLLLSFVSHGSLVLIALASGSAIGETQLHPGQYFFLVPIGLVTNSIPVGSPGGVGVGENFMDALFEWANAPGKGANVMLLLRCAQLAIALFGGVLYAMDKRRGVAPVTRYGAAG